MNEKNSVKKLSAWIVEDDLNQADIFSHALHLAGFETKIIPDGQAVLDLLATELPSLIVLDLHLPYVSGDKLLHRIRSLAQGETVRIILATANPQMADPLRDEADLVLLKPVSFNQLKEMAMRLRISIDAD